MKNWIKGLFTRKPHECVFLEKDILLMSYRETLVSVCGVNGVSPPVAGGISDFTAKCVRCGKPIEEKE